MTPNKNAGKIELQRNKNMETPFLDALLEGEAMANRGQTIQERALEKNGWIHTSSTPTCCWMWQKKILDGRTLLVNFATAIDIEKQICGESYGDEE